MFMRFWIKGIFISFLAFFCSVTVYSQAIFGVITDEEGSALPYTNIYVPSLKKGTTSNAEGVYRLILPSGKWKVEFRNIGYVTFENDVLIEDQDVPLDIILRERSYRIGEIKVLASGEDPAVYVMRRAISMAPYYKNQVSEYKNTVYLKGSGKFGKVPRLLRKSLEKQGLKLNDVYSIESISKIQFKLPDQLKQQVIAQRTSGNDNNTSPMPMITSNLYNTQEYGIISPFDRQALKIYQFRLLGMFEDQGRMINRIQVTPRRKGNDVFEGIINVADGYWSVHSADLKLSAPMMSVRMKQLYGPVDINAWMPVSLSFDIIFSGLGFEFDYIYVASLSDYEVQLNPNLDHSFIEKQRLLFAEEENIVAQIDNKHGLSASSRNSEKMQELLHKDELTTRDSRRLNRMLERETKTTNPQPPLEIEQRIFMDSVIVQRDSLFWENIRPIPLTESEISGFARKDSLIKIQSTPAWRDSVELARRRFKPLHVLMGATYSYHPRGSASRNTLTIPGLSGNDALSFNTVDGVRINLPFRWHKRDTLGHSFTLNPTVGYAIARKKADASLSVDYMWDGSKRASVGMAGGTTTVDFNQASGMSVYDNDFHSLWYERNYKKFYRRDFLELYQQIEIFNGLNLLTTFSLSDRKPLQNHSGYKIIDWSNRSYTDNIPINSLMFPRHLEPNRSMEIRAEVNWTPRQRYFYRNGFKRYASSVFPTFYLKYNMAVPGILKSEADFSYVEIGLQQKVIVGNGNILNYKASAGGFLNHYKMHFSDFRHFATNYAWLFTGSDFNKYSLNPYYDTSTNVGYVELHSAYESGRILIKRLPVFANTIFTEQLNLRFLHNIDYPYYIEFSYALRNILAVFSLEAVSAFRSGKFESAGLKLGLNLPDGSGN